MNEGYWPGSFDQVLEAWKLTEYEFWDEVVWIEEILQGYYNEIED